MGVDRLGGFLCACVGCVADDRAGGAVLRLFSTRFAEELYRGGGRWVLVGGVGMGLVLRLELIGGDGGVGGFEQLLLRG